MKLSTHYYILSLSEQRSRLYEAFRDNLIDIRNTSFPFDSKIKTDGEKETTRNALQGFIRGTDQHFSHYYEQDPLMVVVIGEKELFSIFESLTTHHKAIIGNVVGDFSETSCHDLGKIVWPVVKKAMAGTEEAAISNLESLIDDQEVALGIDAVAKLAYEEAGCTLYVEEDYHVASSILKSGKTTAFSKYLDENAVFDDAVDVIIERILELDGNVVFLGSGSLTKFQRIALISAEQASLQPEIALSEG